MGAAMTMSTPQDQVDQLIQEVADESGLDVIDQLKDLNPTTSSISASKTTEHQKEDDLSRRFVIDLLHIPNLIIKLYIFNTFFYRSYDRLKWYPLKQDQWKRQWIWVLFYHTWSYLNLFENLRIITSM